MNIQTDERVINYIRKKIKASQKIVAVIGIEMLLEGGGIDLDSNAEHYRLEEEYGFGAEDMLSTSFFNAKVEKFYYFYKKEVLGMNIHTTPAYDALMKLQDYGKLLAVINQNFHGLPPNVNLKNVIDFNGNLNINKCPRCYKDFDIRHIMKTDGLPLCDKCKVAIRPGIRLIGERANTGLMTDAATVCEAADVLLVLGKNIYNDRLEYGTTPEQEQLKVLFSKKEPLENNKIDFVIKDDICEFLPLIIN